MLSVTPSAATRRASTLKAAIEAGAVRVGELQRGDRLAHGHRGDGHDAPPAALAHPGQHALQEGHRGEDERAVRGLPLLAREAERVLAGRRAARVGDVDVDRAELGLHLRDEPGHRVEVVRVERQPEAAERFRRLAHALRIPRGDGHAGALRGELARDAEPDPARSAGHQRHAALQAEVHGRP